MATRDTDPTVEAELREDEREATVAGGLDENVAGALCYVLGFVTGLIFYLVEEENEFVRFHAVQSMLVFGGLFLLNFVFMFAQIFFEFIPFIGWIFSLVIGMIWLLVGPIALILWIVLIVKAYKGDRFSLPVVGPMAENYV